MKTPNKLLQLIRDNARADAGAGAPQIRTETTDTEAHVYVYDVIDPWYGCSAQAFLLALQAAGDRTVHLHINSPGGDVFEARAMSAAVVAHKAPVIAHIDGLAASAASFLALSANEVRMTEGGLYMIHNSWSMAWGNKTELRATADLLEKVDASIAGDYAAKTGKDLAAVANLMEAETWFTAAEALAAGFVDHVDANTRREEKATAQASAGRWNLSAYSNAPKLPEPPAAPARDIELDASIAHTLQMNRNRLRLFAPA